MQTRHFFTWWGVTITAWLEKISNIHLFPWSLTNYSEDLLKILRKELPVKNGQESLSSAQRISTCFAESSQRYLMMGEKECPSFLRTLLNKKFLKRRFLQARS